MVFLAQLRLAMFVQQTLLLAHAQLTLLGQPDAHETAIASGAEGVHPPNSLVLAPHNSPLLKRQKPLRKRVVNIDTDDLIPILRIFLNLQALTLLLPLSLRLYLDKFPNIILRDMIAGIRTARNLIV
jgi:hypothetical protein